MVARVEDLPFPSHCLRVLTWIVQAAEDSFVEDCDRKRSIHPRLESVAFAVPDEIVVIRGIADSPVVVAVAAAVAAAVADIVVLVAAVAVAVHKPWGQ